MDYAALEDPRQSQVRNFQFCCWNGCIELYVLLMIMSLYNFLSARKDGSLPFLLHQSNGTDQIYLKIKYAEEGKRYRKIAEIDSEIRRLKVVSHGVERLRTLEKVNRSKYSKSKVNFRTEATRGALVLGYFHEYHSSLRNAV